jgi:hypothetical protein
MSEGHRFQVEELFHMSHPLRVFFLCLLLLGGCSQAPDPESTPTETNASAPEALPTPKSTTAKATGSRAVVSEDTKKNDKKTSYSMYSGGSDLSSKADRTTGFLSTDVGHQGADSRLVEAVVSGRSCLSETEHSVLFIAGIQRLLEQAQYERLEKLAARYIQGRERLPSGKYKSTLLYYALKTPRQKELAAATPIRLQLWADARPRAAVPRIAMARVLMEASEGRWAADPSTLPPPLDEYFSDPLTYAGKFLEEAATLSKDNADLYALLIDHARREKFGLERVKGFVEKGRVSDPYSYHIDGQYARYLKENGEDWQAAVTRPENLVNIYEIYLKDTAVDKDKMWEACLAAEARFPESTFVGNFVVRQAVKNQEWELAAKRFNKLGDQYEYYVWDCWEFLEAREQVERNTGQKLSLKSPPLNPVPDEFKGQQIEAFQFALAVNQLLQRQRFAELDQVLAKVRKNRSRFDENVPKTTAFYNAIDDKDLMGFDTKDRMAGVCNRWLNRYPKSPAANMLRVAVLIDGAWAIRGGGYASSVSDSQWKGFKDHLVEARSHFEKYEASEGEKDPEFYASRITVGMGLDEPNDSLFPFLEKAKKLDPLNLEPYQALDLATDSRWGGTPSEKQKLLEQTPLELYLYLDPNGGSEKICSSAVAMAKKMPSDFHWSVALRLAKHTERKATAKECLDKLEGRWSGKVFVSEEQVEEIRQWVKS